MATRGKIVTAFKLHGLSLKRYVKFRKIITETSTFNHTSSKFSDASRFLGDVLSTVNERELETWLDKIIESVQKQPRKFVIF